MAMLGGALVVLTQWMAAPVADIWAGDQGSIVAGNPAPTAEQIQSLVARVVENQHRNDLASEEFERVEHVVSRKGGDNSPVLSDRTDRVMPSGTGTVRLAKLKRLGVLLPKTSTTSAASITNARSATTTSCNGTDAASRSRPSHNASASLGQRCSSMNLWKERSRSIMQIPNSTSTVDKFTQGGDIFSGLLGGHFYVATTARNGKFTVSLMSP